MGERCSREGDATVFGDVHERGQDPELRYGRQQTLPKLVPSSWFVVPPEEPCPVTHVSPHDLEMRANPYDMDDAERGGY